MTEIGLENHILMLFYKKTIMNQGIFKSWNRMMQFKFHAASGMEIQFGSGNLLNSYDF